MVKLISFPEQNIKKLLLVETQVPLCKTNQQENHLKNTGGQGKP